MLAQNYYQYKEYFNQDGVIFSFSGYISEGILFALGDALKEKLSLEDTDTNTVKRVFSIFVEQVQNIIRYSIERVDNVNEDTWGALSSGIIIVGAIVQMASIGGFASFLAFISVFLVSRSIIRIPEYPGQ